MGEGWGGWGGGVGGGGGGGGAEGSADKKKTSPNTQLQMTNGESNLY